jgi:hypothetical protein
MIRFVVAQVQIPSTLGRPSHDDWLSKPHRARVRLLPLEGKVGKGCPRTSQTRIGLRKRGSGDMRSPLPTSPQGEELGSGRPKKTMRQPVRGQGEGAHVAQLGVRSLK